MAQSVSGQLYDILANSAPSNTPISNLDADLLSNILFFTTEQDVDEEAECPALHTLRHASQVSMAWRDLVIASPTLWGRVINFDYLRQETWRNEVMRRTAGSWLFVRGSCDGVEGIEDIIICLLAENWSRVRSLALDISYFDGLFEHNSEIWRLLKRPADVMVSFKLSFQADDFSIFDSSTESEIFSPPDFVIFNNRAPNLRSFSSNNIKFDIGAPWTKHLRRLALNIPFSVSELLDALRGLPLLETLESHQSYLTYQEATVPLPQLTLPRLQEIIFRTSFYIPPYMTFLAHLTPAPGLCLDFFATPLGKQYAPRTQGELAAAGKILQTYSQCFGLSTTTTISLVLLGHQFGFKASAPTGRSFAFNVDCLSYAEDAGYPVNTTDSLLKKMTFPGFPSVRALSLMVENSKIPATNPKFIEFILSVASTKILLTNATTLRFLLGVPKEILKVALPSIQAISVDRPHSAADVSAIRDFLASRAKLGKKLSTLMLQMRDLRRSVDMRSLEANVGLNVVVGFEGEEMWEYTCGSGSPEELVIKRRDPDN